MKVKKGEYSGSSEIGIIEAIENALQKAGEHARMEVIETRSSQQGDEKRFYQVVVSTFEN